MATLEHRTHAPQHNTTTAAIIIHRNPRLHLSRIGHILCKARRHQTPP